jgi:hypothetical protein
LEERWNFTIVTFVDLPVHVGWNLVSLPLVQVNTSVRAVLVSLDGLWNHAMAYDASDQADPWKTFHVRRLDALNDLSDIDHTMGFWLNVTQDATFRVYGLPPASTAIPLRAGWNLVGYPTMDGNLTAGEAFWGTGADIVEAFDPEATYRVSAIGPTRHLTPGQGYWVHVSADSVWYVAW